jgi:hypothetical protein
MTSKKSSELIDCYFENVTKIIALNARIYAAGEKKKEIKLLNKIAVYCFDRANKIDEEIAKEE